MSASSITLRGVEVHNLRHVDLDIPHKKLVVLCGVSGSGKTSLAVDTLYAEGQRRYIESFSAYTRQFLERIEKPAAERIEGIPPAVAVVRKNPSHSNRTTVGTATEIADYLRLLFAKIGRLECQSCGRPVVRDTPQSVAHQLGELADGTRYQVAFEMPVNGEHDAERLSGRLQKDGFVRVIAEGRSFNLSEAAPPTVEKDAPWYVIVDRLKAPVAEKRLRESLETAFGKGRGECFVFAEEADSRGSVENFGPRRGKPLKIDGREWRRIGFSERMTCSDCGREYPLPEPRLFSFNSPLGACELCEGFGNIVDIDMELVVPDRSKSLREGAVAPWNTPAYAHELEELVALADDYDLPLDVPFDALNEKHLRILQEGVPEREFGGLAGFFRWLERRKYKMHLRVFLSRWRSYRVCPDCDGTRLSPEALASKVGGLSIAEISALRIDRCGEFFEKLELAESEVAMSTLLLHEIGTRLRFLKTVGLAYLSLDRTLRTLSGGESQRVALTAALGSSLVNMLYVLDEPSIGLHPRDVDALVDSIENLRDRGNSVVVVEHEEAFLHAADELIEIGPGAGHQGGRVVYQGPPEKIVDEPQSLTGDYLSGRRGASSSAKRRVPERGWIRLAGARGNNLQDLTVEFPLGMLCLVTGVSGAGKSTLVQDTLYPALCRRLRKDAAKPLEYNDVFGDGQIDDCVLVDQSPIGRSPRSNPVTYIKAFDEIRAVFADTVEARTNNYGAGHFSFNVAGGRCNHCSGDGHIEIDMQFLADVFMKCPQCHGTRYRPEILDVKYRGRSIADVLEMTVREAFIFFRGRPKVQAKLKRLIDCGLEYVRLGQPANTLSGGEAQRLKLATYTSGTRRGRTLFLLDEPTTGLHFSDIVQLLDCFDALLAVGHSLIVVEHNLQMMKAADFIIDLGPGAADEGGQIVATGTPEEVARCEESITGSFLSQVLVEDDAEDDEEEDEAEFEEQEV